MRKTYRPETPEGAAHSSYMRSVFSLIGEHDCAINDHTPTLLTALMTIHKKNTQMASGPPEHHVDREGRRLADRSWNFVVAAEKR